MVGAWTWFWSTFSSFDGAARCLLDGLVRPTWRIPTLLLASDSSGASSEAWIRMMMDALSGANWEVDKGIQGFS